MKRDSEGLAAASGVVAEVSDHRILTKIGEGGYGEVWLAQNRATPEVYRAVKVLYRRDLGGARPYETEFEGIRSFEPVSRQHEGLMQVLHVARDEEDAYFYYVTELADDQATGQDIDPGRYTPKTLRSELKRRGRLPFAVSLEIGLAVAGGLSYLHQKGLVHRDIKPSNIVFVGGKPKLADAGLVTVPKKKSSSLGTAGYVAPEGSGAGCRCAPKARCAGRRAQDKMHFACVRRSRQA